VRKAQLACFHTRDKGCCATVTSLPDESATAPVMPLGHRSRSTTRSIRQRSQTKIRFQTELRNAFLRTLSNVSPSILILFEDNAESDTGIWIDAANVLGIPSVIIPFTVADALEPAQSHWPDPLFHVSSNKYNELVAQRFPHWTVMHKGARLIRRPGISFSRPSGSASRRQTPGFSTAPSRMPSPSRATR